MKDLVIAGAIFDLDGTLLDSMHIWRDFASAYLLSRGITPPEDLEDRIGPLTLREAAEYLRNAFSLPEPLEEVLAGMDAATRALYETVLPKPGVPALLAGMKAAGIPMAVATLTDRPTVLRVLDRLGLLPYFSSILTCAEVGAGKDEPRIFLEACAALGTRREETAVFEDALYAVRTAASAGFPVVAVYDASGGDAFGEAAALAALAVEDFRAVPFETYFRKRA